MSADILEDVSDDRGTDISFSVHAQSGATLSLMYEDDSVSFRFSPTEAGIATAHKIIHALQLWIGIAERQIALDADTADKVKTHLE